uniref:Uncharacterized protein n=1 Tax=Timema cristinae TaxID=61476 RepID=A0A7R9DRT7_TIMCR|nr:unnamed protein product [Timema cristinae]
MLGKIQISSEETKAVGKAAFHENGEENLTKPPLWMTSLPPRCYNSAMAG